MSQVISGLLFEGLTKLNREDRIENAIAIKIQKSSDLKEYTFTLRNCFWNDGSLLSAYDFVYAWKKILSPDFKTSFAHLFYPICGAEEAKKGKISLERVGIHALNDCTLQVKLKNTTSYFLELTSLPIYSPVHRFIDQRYPQWPYQSDKNFPCNGPFLLKENYLEQGYTLIKNPNYWDVNNIHLDQLVFYRMTAQQSIYAFHQDKIDWLGYPLGSWHSNFFPEKNDQIISFPNESVCWLVFNTSTGFFKNGKLRKALALIIDRSKFLVNSPLPLNMAFSPLLSQHNCNVKAHFPTRDIELARQLWQQGWNELGISSKNIPALHLILHHKGVREHAASCLQRQFKEYLDAECILHPLPWNNLFEKMTEGKFEIGLMQWISYVNDPIYTLNAFRSSEEGINFSKWEHPFFQYLLNLGDQEADPSKRKIYLGQAEKFLCEEVPVIPLFYQSFQALTKKNIKICNNISATTFNFARSFLKKEA